MTHYVSDEQLDAWEARARKFASGQDTGWDRILVLVAEVRTLRKEYEIVQHKRRQEGEEMAWLKREQQ